MSTRSSELEKDYFYLNFSKPSNKTIWIDCEMSEQYKSNIAPFISQINSEKNESKITLNLYNEHRNAINQAIKTNNLLKNLKLPLTNMSFLQID